jgi:phosphoglycerate dehydrogenase-like enzyme
MHRQLTRPDSDLATLDVGAATLRPAVDDALVRIVVATPLDAGLVAPIAETAAGLSVLYQPDLLPPARWPGDHRGNDAFRRDPAGERRWKALLASADVLLGIPGDSPKGLAAVVRASPRLCWVQGTSGDTAALVGAAGLTEQELARVAITGAGSVDVGPLVEFCLLGLLAFTKDVPRLQADQRAHRWTRHATAELRGATLLVLGLGAVGIEVARVAKALGMRTIGVNRRGVSDAPHVDETHPAADLLDLVPRADAIVVALPLTADTRGLLGAKAIASAKPGAILVDVGRGGVVDEPALIDALREQRLGGAALDVFATEPLPTASPLWDLPNVLICPHAAAPSQDERLVELFTGNLRRYMHGEELLDRVRPTRAW